MRSRTINARADDAVARYLATADRKREHAPITVLHIGAQQTGVASYTHEFEPAATVDLQIGNVRTPAEQFGRYPPTPMALENAIMVVEDEVARARPLVAQGSVLVTDDASVRRIALAAGVADRPVMVVRLEAVEQTFERLVAASLGRPAPDLPANTSFAGTLLILREFMHHLEFSSISIVQ